MESYCIRSLSRPLGESVCGITLGPGREIHWDWSRVVMSSVAHLAVFPLQDVLGLGSEHRMNRPGTLKGNWEWRMLPSQLTEEVGIRLRDLTGLFDRLPMRARDVG